MFQKWKIDKATIMLRTGECSPIWTHHLGVLSPDVMMPVKTTSSLAQDF